MEDLIERTRQHIAQAEDSEESYPPVTLSAIQKTEAELGFALPNLLRELYVQVANGGFGPKRRPEVMRQIAQALVEFDRLIHGQGGGPGGPAAA